MLFSIATLLVANFNGIVALVLFVFINAFFLFCLVNKRLKKFVLVPLFMLVGFVCVTTFQWYNANDRVQAENVLVTGRVCEIRSTGVVLEDVKVANKGINGNVILYTEQQLDIGNTISTKADIEPIIYNYDDTYINHLYDNNIFHSVQTNEIKITGKTNLKVSEKIKKRTIQVYSNEREDTFAIAYAMMFGDTSFISEDIKLLLNKTGLNHIFAVSGLHIGFIAYIIMWLNKKLKIKRLANILLTATVLILYNILCGYSPSMVRATIMIAILLFANEYGLKNDGLSRLSLAGIIILLIKPFSLFTASFELSFFAVFGLIAFARFFDGKFNKNNNKFKEVMCASLAVNFAIFPFICYHFKTFPLLFLPVNMLILPILPFIYSLTMLFTIVNLIIPTVNFVVVVNYLLIPIKIASILVDAVSISMVNIAFTKTMAIFYLLGEVVLTPYVLLSKKSKISIYTMCIILGLVFTLIQL